MTRLSVAFFPAWMRSFRPEDSCIDAQMRGESIGFRGEAWWGQAAGTYFVAILQSINPQTDQAIESLGGWGEIYFRVSPRVTTHVGFGVDDPRDGDLGFVDPVNGVGQISYNEVAWWNAIWNVNKFFELALELSHRRTRFLDPSADNEGGTVHFASTFNY